MSAPFVMGVSAHDAFTFRVADGYQARCKCGHAGTVFVATPGGRTKAVAEAGTHNRKH